MRRKLLVRYIPDASNRAVVEQHPRFLVKNPRIAEAYSQMILDVTDYRDMLVEHRIGEHHSSQKDRIAMTARTVGLQVPRVVDDDGDDGDDGKKKEPLAGEKYIGRRRREQD